MPVQKRIPIKEFCSYHGINTQVIMELESRKLLSLIKENRYYFLPSNQLPLAEKLIRLHLHLGINLEGIEVILPLLERLQNLESHLKTLKNRLNFYEDF